MTKVEISQFAKIEIFGPPTKNSDFSDFSGILALFSTEISRSGPDISIPIINHLLKVGRCFPTIYKQFLWLALLQRYKVFDFCPENMENYIFMTS